MARQQVFQADALDEVVDQMQWSLFKPVVAGEFIIGEPTWLPGGDECDRASGLVDLDPLEQHRLTVKLLALYEGFKPALERVTVQPMLVT